MWENAVALRVEILYTGGMGYAALTIKKIAGPSAKQDGIRAAAKVLELAPATLSRWKALGYIPGHRHAYVKAKARAAGVLLGPADFVDGAPGDNGAAETPAESPSQEADTPSQRDAAA